MKPRDYCCCAIPVLNAGIYATLIEQFVLGFVIGIVAVATPSIVGASVPSFAKWILAIACFVCASVQVFGFLGVYKENSIMFRRYTTLHIMTTVATFSIAAVWIIISATRHSAAVNKCLEDYFADDAQSQPNAIPGTESEGKTLCEIVAYVGLGLMGGLWIVLGIMQIYLYTVVSSYGTTQRRDHEKYNTLYSGQNFNSDIPLATNRGDPWDARPSIDEERDAPGRNPPFAPHGRSDSIASVSTILGEKQQQPRDYGYSDATYPPPQRQPTYTTPRQGSTDNAYLSHPPNAYTEQPAPTPRTYDNYGNYGPGATNYAGGSWDNVQQPGRAQPHPGMS